MYLPFYLDGDPLKNMQIEAKKPIGLKKRVHWLKRTKEDK